MTIHRFEVGKVVRLKGQHKDRIDRECLHRIGEECQVIQKMLTSYGFNTQDFGPVYWVQSYKDGGTMYACEKMLEPIEEWKGSWDALAAYYKPPSKQQEKH